MRTLITFPDAPVVETPAMLQDAETLEAWLNEHNVSGYTVNPDLTVDVKGTVKLTLDQATYLPVQFGTVTGSFFLIAPCLTSLKGCPHTVDLTFDCSGCPITSLLGGPQEVDDEYLCVGCKLETLEGAPPNHNGGFNCSSNFLKNLYYAPEEVGGTFNCSHNSLGDLEGNLTYVGYDLICKGNDMKEPPGIENITVSRNLEWTDNPNDDEGARDYENEIERRHEMEADRPSYSEDE